MVCTEHYYEQILFVLLLAFLRPWDNTCCSSLRGGFHLREIVQVVQEHMVREKNWMNLKIEDKETYSAMEQGDPCLPPFPLFLPSLSPSLPLFFHFIFDLFLFSVSFFLLPFSSPFLSLSSGFLTPNSELESTFETVADFWRECFAIQEGDL